MIIKKYEEILRQILEIKINTSLGQDFGKGFDMRGFGNKMIIITSVWIIHKTCQQFKIVSC